MLRFFVFLHEVSHPFVALKHLYLCSRTRHRYMLCILHSIHFPLLQPCGCKDRYNILYAVNLVEVHIVTG